MKPQRLEAKALDKGLGDTGNRALASESRPRQDRGSLVWRIGPDTPSGEIPVYLG